MNNFMISAKRFFTNKNTVTIIGVVIILVILYAGYNSTVQKAVNPVKVPIARNTILPQTQIVSQDIEWVTIQGRLASQNIELKEGNIVGMYTGVGSTIPQGSMFYKEMLVTFEDLPGSWLKLLKTDPTTGETDKPYYFSVNLITTFANSIQPEMYIDIYMRARDESGLIMFGKLIENVEVLAVKDSSGEDVFSSQSNIGQPAFVFFGLMEELHILLRKAQYINNLGIELVIVPHGGIVQNDPNNPLIVDVSSEYLRDFIDANSVRIPENNEYLDIEDFPYDQTP